MPTWSAEARRDFREREDYRRRHGELDRYRKREDYSDDEYNRRLMDARLDRIEERGWEKDSYDFENDLMQVRNADPENGDHEEALDRLRARYAYVESRLDEYDADYDYLMARYTRLKEDALDSISRATAQITKTHDEGMNEDDNPPKTWDDLWERREG